ncbi:SDR family NAD(P)-dependent oxidoreductase [Ramlibacter sp.]|uniref:SDR family NAD(P)-dependent oxidoreductase n=1 Tax=Ramlibacter sp. TaxID=1917967 RepID=UPI002FC8EE77
MNGGADRPPNRLDGRTAFVTGAAIGIGRAIATRLAQEGADLMLFDINQAEAEETAHLVRAAGRRCVVIRGDVGDYVQVKIAVDSCVQVLGSIDIMVNNAGISPMGTIADTSLEDFRNVFRVNVDGVFHGCKAVAPHMMERKSGKIINISSWFGKVGKHSYGPYCASKFAVIGLTQSMAMEMAAHGVNVNAVCPGTIVNTGMREQADREAVRLGRLTARQRESGIPLGRVGLPQDISRVVAFLASEDADYMTGQSINVTGGLLMH